MTKDLEVKKASEAKILYGTLCSFLDGKKLKYEKDESNLIVRMSFLGKSMTINFFIKVDASRSVMYLKSPMPFVIDGNNKEAMIHAVTMANWTMLNGMFEIDLDHGYIGFKLVVPFMESLLSEQLCKYMIDTSYRMVNIFNEKLGSVADGAMSLEEFEAFSRQAIK